MTTNAGFTTGTRVGVWGVGLLGGSIGLGLAARGHAGRVVGIGRNPERLRLAESLGACHAWTTEPREVLADLDLLVLCVPVDSIAPLLCTIVDDLPAHLVITDVGSTKGLVVQGATKALGAAASRFVGSHPMAGSEKSGVEKSTADLYEGATIAVTPHAGNDESATRMVEDFWRVLGGAVVTLSPDDHDEIVSTTSHLPHLVAALLALLYGERAMDSRKYPAMIGNGFLDTTRVAAGDAVMWRDILMHNRTEMGVRLNEFAELVERARRLLREGDSGRIEEFLEKAAGIRRGLDKTP